MYVKHPRFCSLWLLAWLVVTAPSGIALAQSEQPEGTLSEPVKDELPPIGLNRPSFPEDSCSTPDGWTFGFHGYARMPLRIYGSLVKARPPYLVDDDYYLSGFAYTRVNETEWAEIFLSAQYRNTRFAVGLFSSEFSDWSETTLQGQGGIATAFVEHDFLFGKTGDLSLRAGMFWDREGYVPNYDTYLFGRMHIAGLRLRLRLWDRWYLKLGYGAHAEVLKANQGFTPVAWLSTGVDLGWGDAAFFFGTTWTEDSDRQFSIIEDGSLRVYGGEVRAAIPYFGPFHGLLAFIQAKNVLFLANAFELLHSTGGRGLTQNFFGPDSDNGNGEILSLAMDMTWQPSRSISALWGRNAGRALDGLEIGFFGMLAWAASNQASDNPLENFHDRVYIKWGVEPLYRPPFDGWSMLFASLRFDRVILDKNHDSMSFRVLTPKLGITPIWDPRTDIFVSLSWYFYGENVHLRPNQVPGDQSVTEPDGSVFKLQAQVSW